jgi:hypothetical protein
MARRLQLTDRRARLLQPVRHVHVAVHHRRRRDVRVRLLVLAGAPVELAKAGVAVGHERARAARFWACKRLAVVGLASLGAEPVGMGGDLAEQVHRAGRQPGLARRGFQRAVRWRRSTT